jgi:hypothetical protein
MAEVLVVVEPSAGVVVEWWRSDAEVAGVGAPVVRSAGCLTKVPMRRKSDDTPGVHEDRYERRADVLGREASEIVQAVVYCPVP